MKHRKPVPHRSHAAPASSHQVPRAAASSFHVDIGGCAALVAFGILYGVIAVLRGVSEWVGPVYVAASVVCFGFYALDKSFALDGLQRVSERTLLALGLVGGWPGAIVAQQLLRHKTAKKSFRVAFWITVAVNVLAFVAVTLLWPPGLAATA